jgi:predicted Zn-dependent peptidase
MLKAKILMGSLLIAASLAGISQEVQMDNSRVKQLTLNNGLTVILDENHAQPKVFGLVMVKAGGKNDPADATGMAHYQEHMLFKGTQTLGTISWKEEKPYIDKIFQLYDSLGKTSDEAKRKQIQQEINEASLKANSFAIPNEFSNLVNEIGGSMLNAGTGPDYTVFYNMFPSSQIERWLDLYAHRFVEPVFRGFQAELEVVYEEKNLYNDQFFTKLLEEFQKQFFKNHPYGQQTLIGSIEDLKNPSLTKMYDFFKTYYVPNNMALVLSGDFNSDEIIPVIEEKFGKWKEHELPESKIWTEKPFNGREFYQAKLSPVKMGLLGFRAPSAKDDGFLAAEVATRILNNSYSTGLLDKLTLDGKLLAAQALQMPYLDHGAVIVVMLPKILGQSLEDAESLVNNELGKLKRGEFDDWMLEAVKLDLYRNHVTTMEKIDGRALYLGEAFAKGQSAQEALDYPNKIMRLTKDDVVAAANQIFGDSYLAFYSKMGFPKKEKIEKPDFKPLLANTEAKSEYAKHFFNLPSKKPDFNPIVFDRDVETVEIGNGHKLMCVQNPANDIFSLTINFMIGENTIPLLRLASQGMGLSGAGSYNVTELKSEFARIGASYNIASNDYSVSIELQGVESELDRALELVGMLVGDPRLEQSKIKTIVDGETTARKVERSQPDNVAQALLEYTLYGDSSNYLNRLSSKQLKNLKAEELVSTFKKATEYNTQIYYCGKTGASNVAAEVSKHVPLAANPKHDTNSKDRLAKHYNENTIYLVDKPKARQSKVFVFINGQSFTPADAAVIDAFNDYFGGGFSGLILQEIREYRSLAYSAGGKFKLPRQKGNPADFIGYVGTQSDKTLTAMETFNGLMRQMPEKPERMGLIRSHLELLAQTDRPNFRELASRVDEWRDQGFEADPAFVKLPAYQLLKWQAIEQFYADRMKGKPAVYMIVGDKKQINLKELSSFGKVIELKEDKLFNK